jgi:phosphatidylserine/phosphatidylglycerophosphate/cardiolipin synthase-like enzyme
MAPFSTNPEDWFLGPDEIGSRAISVFTSYNSVLPYIDAKQYMADVYELIQATRAGDFIYLTGLELSLDLSLLGGSEVTEQQKKDSAVCEVLKAAQKRKVEVKILLSGHLRADNEEVCDKLDKLGITCIIDRRLPRAGSAHQKILLVLLNHDSGEKTLHGFCGGIDLTLNRWDERGHPKVDRIFTKDAYEGGWHDVHCRLQGRVCCDLEATFLERWNDPRDPSSLDEAPEKLEPKCNPLTMGGTMHVQVLRTYACRREPENRYPFAEHGEFTARSAVFKTISMAREYIYIEDQYFVSNEIAEALWLSLELHPDLHVVVVVPHEPDSSFAQLYMDAHQLLLISGLIQKAPGRFAIYELRNPDRDNLPIYVHSKLMIVDDVWVGIGSMNMNRRSMTHDHEIALAYIDETLTPDGNHCQFARELRMNLWAEHLGLDPSEIEVEPIRGFEQWKERSQLDHVRATPREIELGPLELVQLRDAIYNMPSWVYNDIVDPQGLCKGKKLIPPPPYQLRSL